jgi:acyl-CoA thioester hydrolase
LRPSIEEIRVTASDADIDRLGHVNNVIYLQWVQDAAERHWRHVATPAEQEETLWVAVRHEIDYEAPAFCGDELVVRTWVERWTGVTSERHTDVVRPSDGKLLARARTVWCAVDAESQRPCRVTADLKRRFLAE